MLTRGRTRPVRRRAATTRWIRRRCGPRSAAAAVNRSSDSHYPLVQCGVGDGECLCQWERPDAVEDRPDRRGDVVDGRARRPSAARILVSAARLALSGGIVTCGSTGSVMTCMPQCLAALRWETTPPWLRAAVSAEAPRGGHRHPWLPGGSPSASRPSGYLGRRRWRVDRRRSRCPVVAQAPRRRPCRSSWRNRPVAGGGCPQPRTSTTDQAAV